MLNAKPNKNVYYIEFGKIPEKNYDYLEYQIFIKHRPTFVTMIMGV